ncbi:hypothetical protein [Cryobacterium sp. N22]|uniref:hypothetical protein n=1 Tax=Cryobacterium sp. N22 TaxID=2048290 RepID=UPI000CE34951|nr:hypothetical protein [Cryobacterium sp. N22]
MTMAEQYRLSARTAAEAIHRELEAGDRDFAFRFVFQAISDMRKACDAVTDFLVQPSTTGSVTWDTFLATAVRWERERQGIPAPEWTDVLPLDDDWVVWPSGEPGAEWAARIRARTPATFAARRIFVTAHDFDSA